MNDHTNKDHPQLVNIKRIHSIHRQKSSTESSMSLQDDQTSASSPIISASSMNKSGSQTNLQTMSSARSSFSNMFKVCSFLSKLSNLFISFRHRITPINIVQNERILTVE